MKNCTRHTMYFVLVSTLLACWWPGQVRAGELRLLGLEPVKVDVDLAYYLNHETRDWQGYRTPQVLDENGIQEKVYIRTNGYVYHPDLLAWHLSGGIIFRQRGLSSGVGAEKRNIDEKLGEYDFRLNFLGSHPVTAGFSMTQNVSGINGDLQQAINVVTNTMSGRLGWTTGKLTQSLTADRNHYVSESMIGTDEIRRNARYELTHNAKRLRTRVRLDAGDTRQVVLDRLFQTRTGRLTSIWRVDRRGRQVVDLNLYYNDQTGQIDNLYKEGSVNSRHELGAGFSGSLTYSRRDSRTGEFDSQTTGTGAALAHQLYQSLRTSLRYTGNATLFGYGDRGDRAGEFRTNYTKKTGLGRLDLYYGYSRRDYREDFDRPGRAPRSEEKVFVLGQDFTFVDSRIDPLSMVVLNQTRPAEILRPGIDYSVSVVGDAVLVMVEPAGLIQDGDLLKFYYDLIVDESFNYVERAPVYGASITIGSALNLGASHSQSNKDLLRGDPGSIVSDAETNAARFRWRRGALVFSGDYSHRRSSRIPTNAGACNCSTHTRFGTL